MNKCNVKVSGGGKEGIGLVYVIRKYDIRMIVCFLFVSIFIGHPYQLG